ncbi:MAG: hypothetical protein SPF19_13270 [Oliverpabstia sp.]|nr:creatininase family protein [Lachnospiraceae bacterium]MDY5027467.1 hypothetical protein [Oliverpabstia sp.]
MADKVLYEELCPKEFEERITVCPIAYLPLGTLEWHGPSTWQFCDLKNEIKALYGIDCYTAFIW